MPNRLVMLPGLDGTGSQFEPFLRALGSAVPTRVVRYPGDPGMGYGGLDAFLQGELAKEPAYVLLAESFSGPLAVMHAARDPQGLQALILCATFVRSPFPRPLGWLRWCFSPLSVRVLSRRILLDSLLLQGHRGSAVATAFHACHRGLDPAVVADRLRAVADVDVRQALGRVKVPVLAMYATRDRLLGRRGLAGILEACPDARQEPVDAPHLLLQTRPEEGARRVREFLDVLPSGRA